MTEAARRIVAFAFAATPLHRVFAHALARNVGSWRVMEKAGLRREGVLRGLLRKRGVFEDVVLYAILRTDLDGIGTP
jgi:ribosomal-protein-alanine N-acetyltransferase